MDTTSREVLDLRLNRGERSLLAALARDGASNLYVRRLHGRGLIDRSDTGVTTLTDLGRAWLARHSRGGAPVTTCVTVNGTTQTRPPAEMTTPALVREYGDRCAANARGEQVTHEIHVRYCAVVDELRRRGVLD